MNVGVGVEYSRSHSLIDVAVGGPPEVKKLRLVIGENNLGAYL